GNVEKGHWARCCSGRNVYQRSGSVDPRGTTGRWPRQREEVGHFSPYVQMQAGSNPTAPDSSIGISEMHNVTRSVICVLLGYVGGFLLSVFIAPFALLIWVAGRRRFAHVEISLALGRLFRIIIIT